ncbi:MAG: cytochrome c [Alphaproteobacteria bacterium]|nr:cytochrome c [Alphaproteobacteria bacterium]
MSTPSLTDLMTGRARLGLTGMAAALLVAGCGQQAGETETAAAETPPIVQERQEGYKALGSSFKLINDQLKSGAPDMAQIAPAANRMNALAQQIPNWFPAGSGPQDGVETDALETIWTNPEGFASLFITEINNALADHIAERIEFEVTPAPTEWGYDLNDLFPAEKEFPQRELIEASPAGLYNKIQYDSDVEQRFVIHRLNQDDQVLFYFKFPPAFKIDFPRVIGNYNPDWGIARYRDGKILLELVRETKGREELQDLQFPHEARKIRCAQKHFKNVGIDYRVVSDETADWWEHGPDQIGLPESKRNSGPT